MIIETGLIFFFKKIIDNIRKPLNQEKLKEDLVSIGFDTKEIKEMGCLSLMIF